MLSGRFERCQTKYTLTTASQAESQRNSLQTIYRLSTPILYLSRQ